MYMQGLSLLHEQLHVNSLHISWGTSSVHAATVVGLRIFDPSPLDHLLVVRIFDPSSLDHLLVVRNTGQVALLTLIVYIFCGAPVREFTITLPISWSLR